MSEVKKKIGFVQIGKVKGVEPFVAVIEVGIGGFSAELERAIERGENPAQALLFLAQLAANHCNPHHTTLCGADRAGWEKYFGPSTQQKAKSQTEPTDRSAS